MSYAPGPPPQGLHALPRYVVEELRRIASALAGGRRELLQLEILHAEPRNADDGAIIYADGIDFDPGAGTGFYGRKGGAWIKLE